MRHLVLGIFVLLFAGIVSAQSGGTGTSGGREAVPLLPITIYHLEARRSERIVWLMEELGFPYELEFVRGNLGALRRRVACGPHGH